MATLTSRLLPLVCLAALAVNASATPRPDETLDIPRINCAGSTSTTLSVNIQAGASGAPFGFLIEWQPTRPDMTCDKWDRVSKTCHAMFVPQSANSPFALGPYWQIVVTLGNLDTSNPEITTNCPDLKCGTNYCIRAKALAGSNSGGHFIRSPWTDNAICSTSACGGFGNDICSYSQGGFGAPPNGSNPATLLLDPSFPYPVALCDLSFVDQPSIEAYLPHTGQPGPITNASGGGSLAGQILAAKLNMIVSDLHLHAETCCTQTGVNGSSLKDLKMCFDSGELSGLNGLTVGQAVDEAETALCTGQLPSGVPDFGTLASIIEQINLNFHGETTCTDNGHLCPP